MRHVSYSVHFFNKKDSDFLEYFSRAIEVPWKLLKILFARAI